jgi:hypothetical protein
MHPLAIAAIIRANPSRATDVRHDVTIRRSNEALHGESICGYASYARAFIVTPLKVGFER